MPVEITGGTRLTGIIGWPVAHSMSPAMHNAAFAALGLNWCYLALPVLPDHVGEAVRGLRALGFVGANVTVPHKRAVMPYLDEISPTARTMSAVNTIVVRDGRLLGDNTDWLGFLASLREEGFEPEGTRCAVLGAGGAARAVVYALASIGSAVTVYNRTLARAEELISDMSAACPAASLRARPLAALAEIGEETDLIVNTTSLGMWPETEASPWPLGRPFPGHVTACDLIYNPLESLFLSQARAAGAEIINGLGMLVHQGAIAFETWTGQQAPIEAMRAAALKSLSQLGGGVPNLFGKWAST
jgi:shikimate dehydrogenase